MRQELVVGQSPCSRKLPGQCNGACSSVSENLETRDARHYYAWKLFHVRVFSFCSPVWGGGGVQIHLSLCSAKKSSSILPLLKISKGAKGMVGFLYPLLRATRVFSRLLVASLGEPYSWDCKWSLFQSKWHFTEWGDSVWTSSGSNSGGILAVLFVV